MQTVNSNNAPKSVGPYSHAVVSGNMIYTSGQISIDPATGTIPYGIVNQTEQIMKNLSAVLRTAESGFDRVIKTTCYLTDMADFAEFNAVYEKYFSENKPARSCVVVKELPKGALAEVEVIATR